MFFLSFFWKMNDLLIEGIEWFSLDRAKRRKYGRINLAVIAKYPETGQQVPCRKDEATSGFLARAILVQCSTSVFRMDACPGNLSWELEEICHEIFVRNTND